MLRYATLACAVLFSALPGIAQTNTPGQPAAENESPSQPGLQAHVGEMFAKGEYDAIDRIADRARAEKTRVRGGIWAIRHVYNGFGVASPIGYGQESIDRLSEWIARNPASITARVAMAEVYTQQAWSAGGTGHMDKLSPETRKVFLERIAKAHATLDDAATLPAKCPEWYLAMLSIAKAEAWDNHRTEELFEEAVAYEPKYFYYYDAYANYQMTSWQGRPGQAASFAKASADRVGGEQGDFLYYEMAAHIIGDMHFEPRQLDWDRVQRGHAALARMYQSVNNDRNQFAFLAWRFQDADVAKQQFAQIAGKWAPTIWDNREQFDQARGWADLGGAVPVAATR